MTEKGFAPIIIILIIVVVVAASFYIGLSTGKKIGIAEQLVDTVNDTPQSTNSSSSPSMADETTNWKTYTNTELGFSVRYPENVMEYYFPGNSGSYIEFSLPDVEHPYLSGQNNKIEVMWSSNPELTSQEYNDILIQQQKDRTPNSTFIRSSYTIDNKNGELIIEKRDLDTELRYLSIQTTKNNLEFRVMYKTESKEKTVKLFDKILSTFKFD